MTLCGENTNNDKSENQKVLFLKVPVSLLREQLRSSVQVHTHINNLTFVSNSVSKPELTWLLNQLTLLMCISDGSTLKILGMNFWYICDEKLDPAVILFLTCEQ